MQRSPQSWLRTLESRIQLVKFDESGKCFSIVNWFTWQFKAVKWSMVLYAKRLNCKSIWKSEIGLLFEVAGFGNKIETHLLLEVCMCPASGKLIWLNWIEFDSFNFDAFNCWSSRRFVALIWSACVRIIRELQLKNLNACLRKLTCNVNLRWKVCNWKEFGAGSVRIEFEKAKKKKN